MIAFRVKARLLPSSCVILLALGTLSSGSARVPAGVEDAIGAISADELRAHVSVLASDAFMGRGLGHPGNRQAEFYIGDALRRAHVPPAGESYFQPVQVYQPRLGAEPRLTIEAGDAEPLADFTKGLDFYPLAKSSDSTVSGPLVYAGYGVSAPQWGHDDYARITVTGAVVLVQDGAPPGLQKRITPTDEQEFESATLDHKITDARAHGAVGLVVIREYLGDLRSEWPEHSSVRSASYRLYAPMRAAAFAVAALSSQAAAPVRRALDDRRSLTARLSPDIVAVPVMMDNVIGMVAGRDGERSGMVVVGAHLDHDGIDEAGEIYNGADDNASGTAAVLAVGAAFARAAASGHRPLRTVVFALWNGEEKGSLGAEYYVTSPVPPLRLVANVNLDMVGRNEDIPDPDDSRYRGFLKTSRSQTANVVHLLGYSYSPDLARAVEQANATVRLTLKEDYDRGAQHLVQRSDNWPFLEHGVPAIFLTTGLHPDYHTPADDTDRIDFGKLERIAELAGRATWLIADGAAPRLKTK